MMVSEPPVAPEPSPAAAATVEPGAVVVSTPVVTAPVVAAPAATSVESIVVHVPRRRRPAHVVRWRRAVRVVRGWA